MGNTALDDAPMLNDEKQQEHPKRHQGRQSTTVSQTSKSSTKYRIHTCFGVMEFNVVRTIAVVAMLLNLMALIAVGGLTIQIFMVANTGATEIMIARGDGMYYDNMAHSSIALAAAGNYSYIDTTTHINRYNPNPSRVRIALKNIINALPANYTLKPDGFLSGGTGSIPIFTQYVTIAKLLNSSSTFNSGKALYNSASVQEMLRNWTRDYYIFLEDVSTYGLVKDNYVQQSNIACLVLVIISLAIIIPSVIAIFVFTLKKENVSNKKLQKVNAGMVVNTMEHPVLREMFRKYCDQTGLTSVFSAIEKIQLYRELCSKSFEIYVKVFDSEKSGEQRVAKDSKKRLFKNITYTEKDLRTVQKLKLEVAFEILTDYLDAESEFAVPVNMNHTDEIYRVMDELHLTHHMDKSHDFETFEQLLRDDLFEGVEKDLVDFLARPHASFKNSLANSSSSQQIQ